MNKKETTDGINELDNIKEFNTILGLINRYNHIKKREKQEPARFIKEYNHINYCEIIIDKNGLIAECIPNHVTTLMGECGYKTREEADEAIPIYESPLRWLVEESGCVAIWYDGAVFPKTITLSQKRTMELLFKHKKISFDINSERNKYTWNVEN